MSSLVKLLDKTTLKNGTLADVTAGKFFWADFNRPTAPELAVVSKTVGLSVNELEELMRVTQRPIVYRLGAFSVIVFSAPLSGDEHHSTRPLVAFVPESHKHLITLHYDHSGAVERLSDVPKDRLPELTRDGTIGLMVAIFGDATNEYYSVVDTISDQLENVEKRMFDYKHSNSVMKETLEVKKSLIYMHKSMVANREVVNALQKQFGDKLSTDAAEQLRDMAMDMTQLTEMVTTYRDILTSTIEIHLTAISNNLNVIMKKVTSWGALILVPSLIAGIFGMNFHHIPTLDSPAGFYVSLVLMVASVSMLAWFFKRRDWL
ncbi:MAG: magnesium transporter CorA family protein [Patescibacteria group bacterium]